MPKTTKTERPLYQRILIDVAGFGLVIISPFTGIFPGPGGIPVFLAGLGLLSINHEWARQIFENFEHWWQLVTKKVFMAHPWISRSIDALCVLAIATGLWLAILFEQSAIPDQIVQGFGVGMITLSTVLLVSNQQRYQRIKLFLKRNRR